MKFWPQKRWKKILLTTLLVVLAALLSVGGVLEYSVYREIQSTPEILNPQGTETALVLYHPGLTDYAKNITYTYAQALATQGWRVEIASVSPTAPTSIADYKLLALVWALYDFNPAPTITNHLHRIGDLNHTKTVIIAIGGGLDPLGAPASMEKTVHDHNGTIAQSFTEYRSQRNLSLLAEKAAETPP